MKNQTATHFYSQDSEKLYLETGNVISIKNAISFAQQNIENSILELRNNLVRLGLINEGDSIAWID